MKKVLILIVALVLVAGAFAYAKKAIQDKDKEGEKDNPVYNPLPEPKNKKGASYKTLTKAQVSAYARKAQDLLPSILVWPPSKVDFLSKLLMLTKESLVDVYHQHWEMYGQKRKKDLIHLVYYAPGIAGTNRREQVIKTLKALITKRYI